MPGDRDADCGAAMEPIGISARDDGEWSLVHRCGACSTVHVNRVAGDDNPLMLMRLAVQPLDHAVPAGVAHPRVSPVILSGVLQALAIGFAPSPCCACARRS